MERRFEKIIPWVICIAFMTSFTVVGIRQCSPAPRMFINSLGMKFVPVPGTNEMFSIWDTRVRDYLVYAQEKRSNDLRWKHPGFKQGLDYPVLDISWDDAYAFVNA